MRDLAIDARQGALTAATHGRAFWILDNLKLIEQLAQQPDRTAGAAQLFAPETAWLTHAFPSPAFDQPGVGENPKYGATVFFNVPASYNGSTPVSLSFLDAQGNTVRSFALHLLNKHAKKPSARALEAMDHAQQIAHALRESTGISPGMNAFVWDMRHAPATEVIGFRMPTANDIDDGVSGPTAVPGTYTVVLDYAGRTQRQPLRIELDPRLQPASGALAARLALAMQIRDTLDALDRTINAAGAARSKLAGGERARLDALLGEAVQMNIHSSEGDLLHETKLRSHLAFLMNELDMAYEGPTVAEITSYEELRAQAVDTIAQIKAATGGNGI